MTAAEFLARKKLYSASACGRGHFDGFEQGEFLERPALDGDRKSGFGERGLRNRRAIRAEGKQRGGGGEPGKEGARHDRLPDRSGRRQSFFLMMAFFNFK